jgi:hypothetical protein
VSRVKVYSFTAPPNRQWTAVTPIGLVVVEPGQQVTIVASETWEQAADVVRSMRETKPESE